MEKPVFFKSPFEFHKWLKKNHVKKQELWIGFYKKTAAKKGITYPEALDEALCFGWIDGIRKSVDDVRYKIRYTPRKHRSIWSTVNIKRANELKKLGLMQPTGLRTFIERDERRTKLYSFEQGPLRLGPSYEKKFKQNRTAWNFFQSQPPSYQKPAMWWVISARQEDTRVRRLNTLIKDSEEGRRIKLLQRSNKKL
jgi:uncharacterized protein YdeI (YjbR/CyaY-like superfamily)